MKSLLIFSFVAVAFSMYAQIDTTQNTSQNLPSVDTLPKKWKLKAIYGLNGTQTSFVNWNAGGRNNVSLLGSISASANFEKNTFKWTNDFSLALGGLQYIEKGSKEGLQKTDDRIDIASNIGYKLKEHYYFSFIGGFKTQMLDGFSL